MRVNQSLSVALCVMGLALTMTTTSAPAQTNYNTFVGKWTWNTPKWGALVLEVDKVLPDGRVRGRFVLVRRSYTYTLEDSASGASAKSYIADGALHIVFISGSTYTLHHRGGSLAGKFVSKRGQGTLDATFNR